MITIERVKNGENFFFFASIFDPLKVGDKFSLCIKACTLVKYYFPKKSNLVFFGYILKRNFLPLEPTKWREL
jgi:hypothetical protein